MTLSALYPLLLLPLIAVIIIFYLLKQPSKEKLLSSLSLWQSAYQQQHSEKPWEKFRHDLLMYLQIMAILFLIIALCAPVIKGSRKTEQILLVFDTSASMQTLYSKNSTRLEQAKKEARNLLNSSSHNFEATIISCDTEAQLVLNNSKNSQNIDAALDAIQPTDCAGTLNTAIPLCESIYSQWENGTCFFFTDSSLDTKSLPAKIYDFSANSASSKTDTAAIPYNLCLFLGNVSMDEKNTLSIDVTITNYGESSAKGDVNFYINDTILDVQSFEIQKNMTTRLTSRNIPIDKNTSFPLLIKAELTTRDALAADNTAYYVFYENYVSSRILLATQKNSFLESALAGFWEIDQENIYKITSMEDYTTEDTYDLYIFDGMFPETLPKTGAVLLFPDSGHMQASSVSFSELLPELSCQGIRKNNYLNLVKSPVSTHLEHCSFPVSKTLSMQIPADADAVFQLDKGDICGYIQRSSGRTLTVFGFDLHDTDFPLQTDFPILMHNILTESISHHNFSYTAYQNYTIAGDNITYYPMDAGKKVSIRGENKKEMKSFTPASALSTTTTIKNAGIYDFYTKDSKNHAYLSVNFPVYAQPDESDITIIPEFTSSEQADTELKQTGTAAGVPVWKLFLILALLSLILEFLLWIKRQWAMPRPFFAVLRTILVLLLCLAIADIPVTLGKGRECTLFLADVSDSMKHNLSEVEEALQQAARSLPSGSKAGIIAFGSNSRVEHFISKDLHFSRLETTPITSATNLESAIQTAVSMFTEDDSKRIVLLTDGMENEGTAKNMASALKEHNISFKVMKFSQDAHEEVLLSDVRVPEKLSVGETFQAEVTVMSNVITDATLSLYSGNTLKAAKQVSLTNGINHFLFQDTLTKAGTAGYRAIIEPERDTETLNNEYLTFTQAEKKQKLLLIEGREGEAAEFEKILTAGGFSFQTISPFSAPRKLSVLKNYPVVIAENVHADDLPEGFKNILESYINEGGGFLATGGDNSFALGNYKNTSLDKVLPVNSILNGSNEVPETAMALVIDHSGSMGDGNRHITRLDLAKEAAVSALTSLRNTDSIGVLAFDDSFDWVVDFTKASDTETIQRQISSIAINGGTSIYPALSEAAARLSKQSAKIKHIILLTDGQDGFHEYDDLYEMMKKENITLSTVAVSNGADTRLLEHMAKEGGGRYYYTDLSTDIPRIFAQEVFLSSDSYLVNRKLKPQILNSTLISITNPLLEEETPFLYGYIRTSKKPTASAFSLITSDTGDPILAVNNLGLGTAVAFTSDVTNEWTKDFAGRDTYARFWKRLITYCIRQADTSDSMNLSVTAEGNTAHVSCTPYTRYAPAGFEIKAACTDEAGNSVTVPLSAGANNQWIADIPLAHTGIYSLTVTNTITDLADNTFPASSHTDTATSTFASTYSREYELYRDDSTLDSLISLTDAEVISEAGEFYTGALKKTAKKQSLTPLFLLLALLLFIADIALRRFGIPEKLLRFFPKQPPFFLKRKQVMEKKHILQTVSFNTSKNHRTITKPAPEKPEQPRYNTGDANIQTDTSLQKGPDGMRKEKQRKKQKTPELLDTSMLLTSRKPEKKKKER